MRLFVELPIVGDALRHRFDGSFPSRLNSRMPPDADYPPSRAPQTIVTPLTKAAIFLVVTIQTGEAACAAVRALCVDLPGLVRSIAFRDLESHLSCVVGFGSES